MTMPRGWKKRGKTLLRNYRFKTYAQGIRFVNRVAKLADKTWHHPDIEIGYCAVTLKLTTHDAGGLTDKDFDMARRINRLP